MFAARSGVRRSSARSSSSLGLSYTRGARCRVCVPKSTHEQPGQQGQRDRASQPEARAAQPHGIENGQVRGRDHLSLADDALVRLHRAHHVFDLLPGFQTRGFRRLLIEEVGGPDRPAHDDGQEGGRAGIEPLLAGSATA